MHAIATATPLLETRDKFVDAYRAFGETQENLPKPLTKEQVVSALGKQADAVYARRGVILPLQVLNLVLSILLFSGAARILRGDPDGNDRLQLAATVSIPYHLLDAVYAWVQDRDITRALSTPELKAFITPGFSLGIAVVTIKTAILIAFFLSTFVYLRRLNRLPDAR